MARDYKPRNRRKKKPSLPGYIWLLSGLAIGLFIAFIIYLDKQPESEKNFGTAVQEELERIKQEKIQQPNQKSNKTKATVASKKSSLPKEEKYNFYKLLPKLEVFIPEDETRPPEVKTKKRTNTVPSKTSNSTSNNIGSGKGKQYVLQVGSFKNLADAEKLKANLAFLGLEASIQHITIKKQLWHRVRFGPYRDKQQLHRNQNLLKKNDINSNSMQIKE
jgi:cell division protein FtsN